LNGDRVVVKEGIDLKRKRKMGMLIVSFYVQLVLDSLHLLMESKLAVVVVVVIPWA